MAFKYILIGIFTFLMNIGLYAQKQDLKLLVFSKTSGFRHKSIPAGKEFLKQMAKDNNWKITFSEDSGIFNESLNDFDVLVLLNTTGDIFNEQQQEGLKKFLAIRKGFVGIHSASDTELDWPWFNEMIGAAFSGHPRVQKAKLSIAKETGHPAVSSWGETEFFKDEWYNFREPVGKHVNVLATLDESSYEGTRMNMEHPISWYHYYDGGKVFYTGLGHTNENYADPRFYEHVQGGIRWAGGIDEIEEDRNKKWTSLLSANLHDNWDMFMGVPHASVKGLEKVDPSSDGKNGEALGLNLDPKNVFSLEMQDGKPVLHISGEIYAAITSKKEYENYHLKLEFKWGEKKWEPRLQRKRDNGILYHATGPFRTFWNVWMQSQEFQVQEGDMGDFYALGNTEMDIPSIKPEGNREFDYKKNAPLHRLSANTREFMNHANRGFDNEKAHGEWNTLELICFGDTSLHIVNGKVVMALYNSRSENEDGKLVPLTKGLIQIQSEAAEAFYRNIEVRLISEFPRKYKDELRKN